MNVKKIKSSKKKEKPTTKPCMYCTYAHSPHEISSTGTYFLCKCKLHEWSKFVNKDTCDDFQERLIPLDVNVHKF